MEGCQTVKNLWGPLHSSHLLVHYSDNPHKLEYVVDDGEIIINNVSDGNE